MLRKVMYQVQPLAFRRPVIPLTAALPDGAYLSIEIIIPSRYAFHKNKVIRFVVISLLLRLFCSLNKVEIRQE
jgi:hypothetical protein